MSQDSRLVDQLQRFGFSETEASVYLALVERGRAEPSTVASAADVSTSYVYQIAERLEREGLVSVDDHQTPTVIRARPPSEALGQRLREMDDAVSRMSGRYERPSNDFDSLDVVQSRSTLYKRFRRYAETAESELFLAVPAEVLTEVADSLRDAVDRGVLVLLAVGGSTEDCSSSALDGAATVLRSWARGMTVYMAADQERGVIAPSALLDWKHGDAEAITFQNESVAVSVESAFLGTVWPASEERYVRPLPELPRTYERFRPAVFAATAHRRAGRRVEVEASVRPTGTREPESTITGTVADTVQGLLEPRTATFGMQNALYVDTGEKRVSVGGLGGFLEDYEAERVTLRLGSE